MFDVSNKFQIFMYLHNFSAIFFLTLITKSNQKLVEYKTISILSFNTP